jgi:hypothetical protein
MANRLEALFAGLESWSPAKDYDAEQLTELGIRGEVARLLTEVGSGELTSASGQTYHLLDPEGVAYWSREVMEKLQDRWQPAHLETFLIDEGGGQYAFLCSNGVYILDHAHGLLARYEGLEAFLAAALGRLRAGKEPFDEEKRDPQVLLHWLRESAPATGSSVDQRLRQLGADAFRPYDPHVRWRKGDLMLHPTEGRGIVTAVKTTMYIQVEFASGKKTLAHRGW